MRISDWSSDECFSDLERSTDARAWIDGRILDAGPRGVAGLARTVSLSVARHDQHVVDRGVEWAAALGEWLARLSARIGERLADGMPEGAATIVGMSAQDAHRLHTGIAPPYYVLLAPRPAGVAARMHCGRTA